MNDARQIALVGGGELASQRLSCASAVAEIVFVADREGIREYEAGGRCGPQPEARDSYRWGLDIARKMYDLTRAGDVVFVFGFGGSPWVNSLAALGRTVVIVKVDRNERARLSEMEFQHRQESIGF